MSKVTTITFFKFDQFKSKLWAFGMMQYAHSPLQKVIGQTFYKLMGSGKGKGFNPLPDWSVYSLIQVWESIEAAESFFSESGLIAQYQNKTSKLCTIYMNNVSSKGLWSGQNPFLEDNPQLSDSQKLAVITRASIRPSRLWKFWSYVPTSRKSLDDNPGLIYTKGIGEVPLLQMATFSIWKDKSSLMEFAYKQQHHKKAIVLTKKYDWYSEELFARFQIIKMEGKPIWSSIETKEPEEIN